MLGVAAALWLARCAVRSHAGGVWLGITALAGAYVVALQGNIDAVDTWAAVYAAALFAIAELAHSATGTPDLGGADAATRGRYSRTVALGILAGFGTADLLVAAASPGGSGGAGIAVLGVACAAAAFGVLALAARRLSSL